MFGPPKKRPDVRIDKAHDRVDTVIGAGTVLIGDIEIKGTLRVDGRCDGNISCAGDVVIGESGHIVSAVQARNIQVAGTIRGDVKTSGILEIASTGKVYGDIEVAKVVIADGAVFSGQCRMTASEIPTTAQAEK